MPRFGDSSMDATMYGIKSAAQKGKLSDDFKVYNYGTSSCYTTNPFKLSTPAPGPKKKTKAVAPVVEALDFPKSVAPPKPVLPPATVEAVEKEAIAKSAASVATTIKAKEAVDEVIRAEADAKVITVATKAPKAAEKAAAKKAAKVVSEKAAETSIAKSADDVKKEAPTDTIAAAVTDAKVALASKKTGSKIYPIEVKMKPPDGKAVKIEQCYGISVEKTKHATVVSSYSCPAVQGACPKKLNDTCDVSLLASIPHAVDVATESKGAAMMMY